jgi:hypothetical protein
MPASHIEPSVTPPVQLNTPQAPPNDEPEALESGSVGIKEKLSAKSHSGCSCPHRTFRNLGWGAAPVHLIGETTDRQANIGDTLTFVKLVYFHKHIPPNLATP